MTEPLKPDVQAGFIANSGTLHTHNHMNNHTTYFNLCKFAYEHTLSPISKLRVRSVEERSVNESKFGENLEECSIIFNK